MINDCYGDAALIEQTALLEGAKFDIFLKNFFAEGKDYKGLKGALKEIVQANQLDEEGLKSGHSKFLHACKRILQVSEDLGAAFIGGSAVGTTIFGIATLNPMMILIGIVDFVINFIINRLWRLLWDTIEFNTIKKDSESIVDQLKANAQKTTDEKLKAKYLAEAERLENAIIKYSNKKKEKEPRENKE